jgi:glycosyltransferase involved in cell wall biosynthesis
LVFPSLNEGFGIPILEAQQAGIPVACSDLSSLPEVAGEGARLFDPRQPADIAAVLGDLAVDGDLCHRLIRAGRANLERFDFDREAVRFAAALRAAAKRG